MEIKNIPLKVFGNATSPSRRIVTGNASEHSKQNKKTGLKFKKKSYLCKNIKSIWQISTKKAS